VIGKWGAGIGLVAALVAAAPAQAAPEWHVGTTERATVANCLFNPETGIAATAFFESDPQVLPEVGEVFYVRTVAARVGNGCGIDMKVHVEAVLPTGVETAISPGTPVRCRLWDFIADAYSTLDGCPTAAQPGIYGPAFDQVVPGGATPTVPWTVPYTRAIVMRTKAGAKRLRRLRRSAQAKLRVTVTAPGGGKAVARATIRLRP
jgi:hypothetical protein